MLSGVVRRHTFDVQTEICPLRERLGSQLRAQMRGVVFAWVGVGFSQTQMGAATRRSSLGLRLALWPIPADTVHRDLGDVATPNSGSRETGDFCIRWQRYGPNLSPSSITSSILSHSHTMRAFICLFVIASVLSTMVTALPVGSGLSNFAAPTFCSRFEQACATTCGSAKPVTVCKVNTAVLKRGSLGNLSCKVSA